MRREQFFRVAAAATLALGIGHPALAQSETDMSNLLDNVREKAGLVGAAAGVLENGEVVVTAASGVRVSDGSDPLKATDRFHIGSLTKSFTATMVATLVDDGTIAWGTRVAEIFPDADSGWSDITIYDLLTHQSGARSNFPMRHFADPDTSTAEGIAAQRLQLVHEALSAPPSGNHGAFDYSNLGYAIVSAMAEVRTGKTWEALVETRVLDPLGIAHGFGPPRGQEAPMGHRNSATFDIPVNPDIERADNPAFMRPSGGLNMSIEGLLNWAKFHLGDGAPLLTPESFAMLQKAGAAMNARQAYGGGWIVDESGGGLGAGRLVWHSGSNTMWYAIVMIFP